MIERVARAICINHGADPDQLGPGHRHVVERDGISAILTDHFGPLWKMWKGDAVVAIEAAAAPDMLDVLRTIKRMRLLPDDQMNRATLAAVLSLTDAVLARVEAKPAHSAPQSKTESR